jgi:hypothetical protein
MSDCKTKPFSESDEKATIIRDAARELYDYNDDVEVDTDAEIILMDHGYWVQAWVYVRQKDVERLAALSFEDLEKEFPSMWSLEGWWAWLVYEVMKKKQGTQP